MIKLSVSDRPLTFLISSSRESFQTNRTPSPSIPSQTLSVGLLWIVTLTLTFSTVYLPDAWHYKYISVSAEFLYVWPAISKIIFTSAIFWSIYSSAFGYNRVLKRILSCHFMICMSRMSMSIVTCQFFYLWVYLGSRRDLIRLTWFDLLREGILAFFLCWFIGFLVHLFIEAPMISLLYTAFGLRRRTELTEKAKALHEAELKERQMLKTMRNSVRPAVLDENSNVHADRNGAISNPDPKAANLTYN